MMDICLYVAEGEIEKRFLNELKQLEYFVPGKFSKFNLMQKRIKVTDNIMSKHYSRIICIIDTDCEELPQLENLKYNLQELITVCGRLEVMVQNKNFEDELIRLMDTDNLLIAFNQKFAGIKELKKFLSQKVIYKNYIDLNRLPEYCKNYHTFKQLWIHTFSKNVRISFITGKNILVKCQ